MWFWKLGPYHVPSSGCEERVAWFSPELKHSLTLCQAVSANE